MSPEQVEGEAVVRLQSHPQPAQATCTPTDTMQMQWVEELVGPWSFLVDGCGR